MPVPTSINDLSTTAASNSPTGADSPSTLDDHIRALASFIATLRDGAYTGSDAVKLTGSQTIAGTKTFSSTISGDISGTATNCSRSVTGADLASGGGPLSSNVVITVTKSSTSQAQSGVNDTSCMTPLKTKQAIETLTTSLGGGGQTWKNVSRTHSVVYQNTTAQTILVSMRCRSNTGGATAPVYCGDTNPPTVRIGDIPDVSGQIAQPTFILVVPPDNYWYIDGSIRDALFAELS